MRVDAGALRMSVHRDWHGGSGGNGLGGEDVLIELAGELDGPGRRCLRDQIAELLGRGGSTVTVDVGGLRRVDIPALAALLRADLLLRRVRGALEIRSATPAFLELVTATGLTGRLRLVPAPRGPAGAAADGRSGGQEVGSEGGLDRAGGPARADDLARTDGLARAAPGKVGPIP